MTLDERDLYSGLAAQHWGAYDEAGWDHEFYRRIIERQGGLALELGCGGGRLLRRYLAAGLEVEGCDISGDILAVCRAKAEAEGVSPVLYEQPMQELHLPKRYRVIYIPCGSFVCVMDLREAQEALRRFYDHLEPGGVLAFNIFFPDYGDLSRVHQQEYPTPWLPRADYTLADGRRLLVYRCVTRLDPIEQYESEERRFELYDGERLIREEVRRGQYRWYFKYEMLMMLERAGFYDVEVKGDYTDQELNASHTGTMVFIAQKR